MTWTTFFFLIAAAIAVWLILYFRGVFEPQIRYRFDRRIHTKSLVSQARLTRFWSQPDQIYAARLEAIQKAQHLIQFETFFMTLGHPADEFAQALIERAVGCKFNFWLITLVPIKSPLRIGKSFD